MKRFFLFILLPLQICMVSLAQNDIVIEADCSKQPLSDFLTTAAVQGVERLTVSGPLSQEDLALVNSCKKLKVLDLTNAELKIIPENAFTETLVDTLFLPKEIELFHMNSVPQFRVMKPVLCIAVFSPTVKVFVTGNFPMLDNPAAVKPIEEFNSPMEFKLSAGNDRYVEKKNCIFTKDQKTLLKAGCLFDVSDRYGGSEEDKDSRRDYFDVERIAPYAFTYSTTGLTAELTFSAKLQSIGEHAFDYIMKSNDDPDPGIGLIYYQGQSYYESLIWEGLTPPVLEGDVLNTTGWVPSYYKVVPYSVPYVASNIQWAGVMDAFDYGVLKGSEYFGNHGLYIDYIKWVYEKNINAYGIVEKEDTTVRVALDLTIPTIIEAVVHNGSTGEMEKVEAPVNDGSTILISIRILDDESNEMTTMTKEGNPGDNITYNFDLPYVPKNDVCYVETNIENKNWLDAEKETEEYKISYVSTGIAHVPSTDSNSEHCYNIHGFQTRNLNKGIYIINGKKILVK